MSKPLFNQMVGGYYFADPSMRQTELPVSTYQLKYNTDIHQFYLKEVDNYTLPKKLYGDIEQKKNRIICTYNDKQKQMGVSLSGLKGSGKTLLAQYVSIELMKQGMPTVLVSEPYTGDGFNLFMQALPQAVVIFDEYEKVYRKVEDQEKLLTLFDGTILNNHLFIISTNEQTISKYLINRPGRIYYSFNYGSLNDEFIVQYCRDNLKEEYMDRIDDLLRLKYNVEAVNFDLLKAFVEEINRYGETVNQCCEVLNIVASPSRFSYKIDMLINGKNYTESYKKLNNIWMNPNNFVFEIETTNKENTEWFDIKGGWENIVEKNEKQNKFKYVIMNDDLGKIELQIEAETEKILSFLV